jgi:hypothetical protein
VRRTQYEYMFSAFLSNSDIARCSRHVSNVPGADYALGMGAAVHFWEIVPARKLPETFSFQRHKIVLAHTLEDEKHRGCVTGIGD